MKNLKSILGLFIAVALLSACERPKNRDAAPEAPVYTPPPPPVFPDVVQPPLAQSDVIPEQQAKPETFSKQSFVQNFDLQGPGAVKTKLDVLFVMDISASMCQDQNRLHANIERFVNVFIDNDRFDFHMGVVTAWDSVNFGSPFARVFKGQTVKNGELQPIKKIVNGRMIADPSVRFVSNVGENAIVNKKQISNILADTIKVGYFPFNRQDITNSGPEKEELFSPIVQALRGDGSPEERSPLENSGFRRPDANLAIIIISDADDSSEYNSEQMSQFLSSFIINREEVRTNVSVHAVLGRYDEMTGAMPGFDKPYRNRTLVGCSSYSVDPALWEANQGPRKIAELARRFNGEIFDLESKTYGDKLASLGEKIVDSTLLRSFPLTEPVDASDNLRVYIGQVEIPRMGANNKENWKYEVDEDTGSASIAFADDFNLRKFKKFNVRAVYKKPFNIKDVQPATKAN